MPRGLPELSLPSLQFRDVDGVIPLAAACFLLAYIEGVSAARTLAQKHGYEINPRQELLALGAANLRRRVRPGLSRGGRPVAVGRERQGGSEDAVGTDLGIDHAGACASCF